MAAKKSRAKKIVTKEGGVLSNNSIVNTKFQPAPGYVLIQPLKAETKTAGGIYLPDSATEKPQTGTVIAVGKSEFSDYGIEKKAPVVPGNVIIYKKWGGNEVTIGVDEFMFIRFEDILAIEKK